MKLEFRGDHSDSDPIDFNDSDPIDFDSNR